MIQEAYLSLMVAVGAGIALYGLFSIPGSVLAYSLKGLLLNLVLFIAGLTFVRQMF